MKAESKENKNSLLAICRSSEAAGGARSNCYEFFGSFCRYKKNEEKLLAPAANDNPELFQYYFNANHLGSGSLITNKVGATYQTLAYAPHGELLVNAIKGTYDEPYKFTGYERDQESGLDYAHARYYWSNGGYDISTDPKWWKSPSRTPYAHCGNNPIMMIDPDGNVPILLNGVWFTEILNYANVRPTTKIRTLTETAKHDDTPGVTDYTINAQMFKKPWETTNFTFAPLGFVVANGKTIAGTSAPERYYVSSKNGVFTFGQGDVPRDVDFGMGGAVPVIINGVKFDEKALGYAKQNKCDVGKSIFAYNSKNNSIMLVTQQNGVAGMTLDEIRDYLFGLGYDNAISFDGSGSATLVQDQKVIVSPDWYRNLLMPTGIIVSEINE